MCEYCEPLLKCPIGESRCSTLFEYREIDYEYYLEHRKQLPRNYMPTEGTVLEMIVKRGEQSDNACLMITNFDAEQKSQRYPVEINYCPMCGKKLIGEIYV